MENYRKVSILLLFSALMLITASFVTAQDYPNPFDTGAAEAAFLGLSGICCFFLVIPFIIGLLIAIWVYKDAEKRGKSGVLWLLVVWLVPFPIGLIIWLVVRPPIGGKASGETSTSSGGSDRRCPNCGRVIPLDANVCPYCKRDFGN